MVAGDALNVAGNGVSIPKQLKAGAVMALNLRGGQKDTAGAAINSEWMPVDTDRKSTRLNSSHGYISYAVFCLKKKKNKSKSPALASSSQSHQRHLPGRTESNFSSY